MAASTKATKEKKVVEAQNTIAVDAPLKDENDALKAQIEELKKMMEHLSTQNENTDNRKGAKVDPEDVDMNARITITSITTGGVNLRTSLDGTARFFRLEKLGQTIPIIYEHLINCINTDRWIFEDGLVYINDARAVREQYLEDAYNRFLTPEKIQNIMDFDILTIQEMISTTTPSIQETVSLLIANKINKGETVDMNKVEAIGKACSPEIDIRTLANTLR